MSNAIEKFCFGALCLFAVALFGMIGAGFVVLLSASPVSVPALLIAAGIASGVAIIPCILSVA